MSSNDTNYRRMIQSQRWTKLRRSVLSGHPLCERCREVGLLVPATEVHHIVPVETQHTLRDMETMMFSPANLEALCHACHVERHRELRSKSKQTIKERERIKLQRFKDTFC